MIHIDDFVIQLEGLKAYVKLRLEDFFAEESTFDETSSLNFINQQIFEKALGIDQLTEAECLLLLIALAPHCQPDFFDKIIAQKIPQAGDFPQIGGTRGKQFRGFLPTGQTAIFLLVGDDPEQQVAVRQLFSADHFFAKKNILWLEDVQEGEPQLSGRIILSQEYVEFFTTGKVSKPRYSRNFPAELIETKQEWSDLVLNSETLNQIKELEIWIKHGDRLLNDLGMDRKLKPGFRALFHGPPGTGKTLTASLLGKYTGRDVFRIDLSMVVSKFIGETEKNLSKLFAKAENKNWILFFDEADALFGKRTNVKDAHDRYANQEVSYLLQRVESYNGLVILATNLKSNLDDAFIRRFQTIIHFPMPTAGERLSIWQNAFPEGIKIDKQIQLEQIANQYELSGAEIMNIVQYACLQAMEFNKDIISQAILLDGIKKEFSKEGRLMN
jgi:DNA polymerase III delta prime subunit